MNRSVVPPSLDPKQQSPPPSRRSLAFNTSTTFATDAVLLPVTVLTAAIVARWLGPDQRGIWAILLAINTIAALLLSLGVAQALTIFAAKRRFELTVIHSFAIVFTAFVGCIGVAGFLVAQSLLGETILAGVTPAQGLLAVLIIPVTLYGSTWEGLIMALEEVAVLNRFKILQAIINFAAPVFALIVLDLDVTGLLVVWAVGSVLLAALRMYWLTRYSPGHFKLDFSPARPALALGLQNYVGFIAASLLAQGDVLLIGYIAGSEETGYYGVAGAVALRVGMVAGALSTASLARISGGTPADVSQLTAAIIRRFWLFAVPIAVGMTISAPLIVYTIFGPSYRAATVPLILLTLVAILRSILQILALYVINHRERAGISAILNWIALFAGIGSIWILTERFGATGGAIGALIAATLQTGLYMVVFSRLSGVQLRALFLWHLDDRMWLRGLWLRASRRLGFS